MPCRNAAMSIPIAMNESSGPVMLVWLLFDNEAILGMFDDPSACDASLHRTP